jgi:hypothetical protein
VNGLTLDGGRVRVRTPKGEASVWPQYHGIRVDGDGIGIAWYKDPAALFAWVTTLPLVPVIDLLGDGHCGIGSLFEQMAIAVSTDAILDWYHLQKNLYKVEAPAVVLESLSSQLWGRSTSKGERSQAKSKTGGKCCPTNSGKRPKHFDPEKSVLR